MSTTKQQSQTNYKALFALITVFFFWGFVAASNDILIPVFKKAFNLTQGESQLVSLAFYIAYTVGSLIYMGISLILKEDIVNKICAPKKQLDIFCTKICAPKTKTKHNGIA